MIRYLRRMHSSKEEISNLFLKVKWNSGKYPDKLYESIKNSTYKIFAYDSNKLIGMVIGLSDKNINLFISYILIDPEYQNKNIGSTLLKKIASIKNFNRIELIADIKDKDFYIKNGFKEDGIGLFKINW